MSTTDRIDFIKTNATRSTDWDNGFRSWTTYFGLVGTAANLKTHRVMVDVTTACESSPRAVGAIEIRALCGTTSRWNASQHNVLLPGTAEVTCNRCNRSR